MSLLASPTVERLEWIANHFTPWAERFFARYPHRNSLLLACAQYWSDEASDAVHDSVVTSNHEVPVWPLIEETEYDYADPEASSKANVDAIVSTWALQKHLGSLAWGDNSGAVRPFQSMCGERGSQDLPNEVQAFCCRFVVQ